MKNLLLSVLLLLIIGSSWAQLNSYDFSSSTGTYTEITGGTVLGSTTTDDQRFVTPVSPLGGTTLTGIGFPIGFNFTFDGVVFDRLAINANGWISLGQSSLTPSVNIGSSSSYTPLSSTTAITPALLVSRIGAFTVDLQAQTGAELRLETVGSSPNRECVVQWKGYKKYSNGVGDNFSFQIRLVETSNQIKLIYGAITNNATANAVQVGLRGAPASPASNYANRTTTTNWSATAAGAAATSNCTLSSTVYPSNGLTFTYSVPSLLNPSGFTAVPLNSSQINLSFTPVGGNNVLVLWDTDNNFTPPAGAPPVAGQPFAGGYVLYYGMASPQPHTGLTGNTLYYYMAYSYNGVAYSTGSPATATTFCGAFSTPFSENFNGAYPPVCWFEAYGNGPNPPVASSAWLQSTYFGNLSPNSPGVKMNVYSTDNDWLISAPIDLGAGNKILTLKVAVTHWNTIAPETMVTGDTVYLLYSTSIYPPYSFNKINAITYYTNTHSPPVTGIDETFDLTGLSGTVRFAFYTVGTGNIPDMDFHIDDFAVFSPSSLSGYVYDFNGNPIPGATVEKVAGLSTISDMFGHYTLSPLASGSQEFKCSKTGYNDDFATVDVPFSGEATHDFTLLQPQMTVEPASIFAILGAAESTTREIEITNDGSGPLEWNAEVQFVNNLSPLDGPAASPLSYCAGSGGCDEFISNVTLGTINNNSVCAQYEDYTSLSTDLITGQTYSISVLIGPPYYAGDQFGAWIDFDQNGIFDEPRITFTLASNLGSGTFTVPQNALAGPTTMRIRLDYNHVPEPCGATTFGEVEDYTVNIIDYSWVKLDIQSGTVPPFGGTQIVTATIDASKTPPILAPGVTYTANILFTSPSGISPVTVPVTLVVTDGSLKGPQDLAIFSVNEAEGIFMLKWKYFTIRELQFDHFVILRNGEMFATSTSSMLEIVLSEPGTFCYQVYAVYEGGVFSDPSNELCITWPMAPGVPLSNWALVLAGLMIATFSFYLIRRRS